MSFVVEVDSLMKPGIVFVGGGAGDYNEEGTRRHQVALFLRSVVSACKQKSVLYLLSYAVTFGITGFPKYHYVMFNLFLRVILYIVVKMLLISPTNYSEKQSK